MIQTFCHHTFAHYRILKLLFLIALTGTPLHAATQKSVSLPKKSYSTALIAGCTITTLAIGGFMYWRLNNKRTISVASTLAPRSNTFTLQKAAMVDKATHAETQKAVMVDKAIQTDPLTDIATPTADPHAKHYWLAEECYYLSGTTPFSSRFNQENFRTQAWKLVSNAKKKHTDDGKEELLIKAIIWDATVHGIAHSGKKVSACTVEDSECLRWKEVNDFLTSLKQVLSY